MKDRKNWAKWVYWFTFAVAVIIVYKTIDSFNDVLIWIKKLNSILMPFYIGVLIAYLLYIPCKKIEKCFRDQKIKIVQKRARGLAVITVYVMVVLIIAIIVNILIPAITNSIKELTSSLPGYYKNAIDFVNDMPEKGIIKKESIQGIIEEFQKIDILGVINLQNVSDYIKSAMGVAQGIFSAFVSVVLSVYVLLERGEILKFVNKIIKAIFKDETYKSINSYFAKANDIFFKFISSQVIDALIVGIIVSIAMWFMRIKYWPLLGFMIGLFNIIPYFGAIVAVTIAVIITLLTGGISKAIWMLIVVIVLQQIDANIINPKIIGNALKLSPILVILSVTVFGAYFGVLGMFLAVPVIAVIKIIVNDFLNYKIELKNKSKE